MYTFKDDQLQLLLTIVAIFTLLQIDGSSLGDGSMLLSTAGKKNTIKTLQLNCISHELQFTVFITFSPNVQSTVTLLSCLRVLSHPQGQYQSQWEREGERVEATEEGKEGREERVALTWMVSNRHTLSPGWWGGICPRWTGWCIASSVLNQSDTQRQTKTQKESKKEKDGEVCVSNSRAV